ncbi:hypothetical protein PVAG01_06147 [Phlyctema vagabunda]|uniref:Myb-like domain-containing protein n=1 Tax=Phlyctema vagabunda TaxID=108571 RepID=A0ABR4PF84_9HELO
MEKASSPTGCADVLNSTLNKTTLKASNSKSIFKRSSVFRSPVNANAPASLKQDQIQQTVNKDEDKGTPEETWADAPEFAEESHGEQPQVQLESAEHSMPGNDTPPRVSKRKRQEKQVKDIYDVPSDPSDTESYQPKRIRNAMISKKSDASKGIKHPTIIRQIRRPGPKGIKNLKEVEGKGTVQTDSETNGAVKTSEHNQVRQTRSKTTKSVLPQSQMPRKRSIRQPMKPTERPSAIDGPDHNDAEKASGSKSNQPGNETPKNPGLDQMRASNDKTINGHKKISTRVMVVVPSRQSPMQSAHSRTSSRAKTSVGDSEANQVAREVDSRQTPKTSHEDGTATGIEEILDNPTPARAISQPKSPPVQSKTLAKKKTAKKKNLNTKDASTGISDPTPSQEDDNTDTSREEEKESEASPAPVGESSDAVLIAKILEALGHVGHKYDHKSEKYVQIRKERSILSPPCQRIYTLLKAVRNGYRDMQARGEAEDLESFQVSWEDGGALMEELQTAVSDAREEFREGDATDHNKDEMVLMIKCLYFKVIPFFTKVLQSGILAYDDLYSGDYPEEVLEELKRVISLILELANAAINQPKNLQPFRHGNDSYSIKRPIQNSIRMLRELQGKWCKEHNGLVQTKNQRELKKQDADRGRRRREKEEEEQRRKAELEKEAADRAEEDRERKAEEERINEVERRRQDAQRIEAQQAILAKRRAENKAIASRLSSQSQILESSLPQRRASSKARLDRLAADRVYAEQELRMSKARVQDARRKVRGLEDVENEADEEDFAIRKVFLEKEALRFEQRYTAAKGKVKELRMKESEEEQRLSEVNRTEIVISDNEGDGENNEVDVEEAYDVERVRVFPKSNTSRHRTSRPWSKEEQRILAEKLYKHARHPEIYPVLAKRLDRSFDDVFEQAKELKEHLLAEREKGLYTDPFQDGWIDDIQVD